MEQLIRAKPVVPGSAAGELLVSLEPISFWGGYDYQTGAIIDRHHPLCGQVAAGKVLAIPFSRGSSTTSAILLEAVRAGTAPAAILTTDADSFFALASIVAETLYGRVIPILALEPSELARLQSGQWATIGEDGTMTIANPATDQATASG